MEPRRPATLLYVWRPDYVRADLSEGRLYCSRKTGAVVGIRTSKYPPHFELLRNAGRQTFAGAPRRSDSNGRKRKRQPARDLSVELFRLSAAKGASGAQMN